MADSFTATVTNDAATRERRKITSRSSIIRLWAHRARGSGPLALDELVTQEERLREARRNPSEIPRPDEGRHEPRRRTAELPRIHGAGSRALRRLRGRRPGAAGSGARGAASSGARATASSGGARATTSSRCRPYYRRARTWRTRWSARGTTTSRRSSCRRCGRNRTPGRCSEPTSRSR